MLDMSQGLSRLLSQGDRKNERKCTSPAKLRGQVSLKELPLYAISVCWISVWITRCCTLELYFQADNRKWLDAANPILWWDNNANVVHHSQSP